MMTFEMKEKIRDAKTKILVLHRFIHSKHPDDIQVVETNKQLLFPDKNKLDESDFKKMVEFMFETIPNFSIRVPESTIITIIEDYFRLTKYRILNDKSIFVQLDKNRRNSNNLSSFGKQELNLKNYIINVMINEERELMNNGLDINIFEEQIDFLIFFDNFMIFY